MAIAVAAVFLMLSLTASAAESQVGALTEETQNEALEPRFRDHLQPSFQLHQPRSRLRVPRSDSTASPEAVQLAYLAQHVSQLSAEVLVLTNRVDTLTTENSHLQDEVTRLKGLEAALAQSDQTIQQQGARLQALTEELTEFQTQSQHQSQAQNKSLARINAAVTETEAKVASLDLGHNVTNYLLQVQTGRVDTLGSRVTLVETRTSQQETMTQALSSWKANVTADVDKILQTQSQALTDQDNLEERVRQMSSDSSTLRSDLTKLSSDWSRLKTNVTTLSTEASVLRNDVTQMSSKLASSSQSVQFFARLSQDTSHSAAAIVMDQVLANHGQAYNASSGNFTVPVGGDYIITAMPMPERTFGNTPRIGLMVDDERLFTSDSDHSSISVAVRLLAGQRVWLNSIFTSRYGAGMYFSGVLVRPVSSD